MRLPEKNYLKTRYWLFLFFFSFLSFSGRDKQNLIIVHLTQMDEVLEHNVNGEVHYTKFEHFLVENANKEGLYDSLKHYALKLQRDTARFYVQYERFFYRKTPDFNLEIINRTDKAVYWKLVARQEPTAKFLWIDNVYAK